jgi:biopolymer transport protein ExbB
MEENTSAQESAPVSENTSAPADTPVPENTLMPDGALPPDGVPAPGNVPTPPENTFGLEHLWTNGDAVSHFVAILLFLMSLASWYLILSKIWDGWRMRRAARCAAGFWAAESVDGGLEKLRAGGVDSPYVQLAIQAHCCNSKMEAVGGRLLSRFDPAEQMERALRRQLQGTQAAVENGLTLLATIGATAPFVGLFGTVWGIYHALVAIGISGQAALEKVAGPVGEALIMTAAGLAVALPAVFAYNACTRANRVALADLDAFAHDLHAFFMVGKPFVANSAQIHPLRARLAAGES